MTVKTAMSIDDALFEKADRLASALNLSRSELFALAVQEFVERYENQRVLDELNEAYADAPDASETNLLQQQHRNQRQRVKGDW